MQRKMKYKIQMSNALGQWGDMKVSEDGSEYITELFDNKEEAEQELDDLASELNEYKDDYRVVTENTPQDVEYY